MGGKPQTNVTVRATVVDVACFITMKAHLAGGYLWATRQSCACMVQTNSPCGTKDTCRHPLSQAQSRQLGVPDGAVAWVQRAVGGGELSRNSLVAVVSAARGIQALARSRRMRSATEAGTGSNKPIPFNCSSSRTTDRMSSRRDVLLAIVAMELEVLD